MIKSLTKQQEEKLSIYAQKWLKIGLSTDPCNVPQTEKCINQAYKNVGLEPPKKYKLFDSPLSCAEYQVEFDLFNLSDPLKFKITSPVWGKIHYQVHHQVDDQVWDYIYDQVEFCIRVQVSTYFPSRFPVWHQVRNQVRDQVNKQVGHPVFTQVWDQEHGNYQAPWWGYYEFCLKELKLDCVKPLIPLINLAKYCGWWAPYKDICLIQHRPKEIHLDQEKQLHKEGGPALSYRDGFSLWNLNGVKVPQWLAETRTEDIDPRKLLEIDNAQVRTEFVRKVGIDRVCYSLKAKCVDKQGSYELLMLDLGDERKRRSIEVDKWWRDGRTNGVNIS